MNRRLRVAIACGLLAFIALVVIISVKQPGVSAPKESATRPGVQTKPAVTAEVAVVTFAISTSAAPPTVTVYVPPAASTPGLAKVVDRRLPFDERVHGLAAGVITEVKDGRDLETLAQLLSDPAEDDTVRHEIASLLFRSGYAPLEACLFKILENPAEKERFRSWAVQHLGNLLLDVNYAGDRQVLADRIRALLTDRHRYVQRMAIQALVQHNDPAVLAKVREMLSDPAPDADAMRDFAIHVAQDKNMREHIPVIRPYARSTNDIIRIAAIVALSQWGDNESRPAIEEAATSRVVRVQRCAKAALAKLDKSNSAQ